MTTTSSQNQGNILGELRRLTTRLHEEIGSAGREGDTSRILSLTDRLRKVDALTQQCAAICREVEVLAHPDSSGSQPIPAGSQRLPSPDRGSLMGRGSRKAGGKEIRNNWLGKHGATLAPIGGTIYRNRKGDRLGVAVSTGTEIADGRKWWLGLPAGAFDGAVLLCAEREGSIHAVCLPRTFIDTHRNLLNKSSAGQDQFNIARHGANWFLRREDIGKYIDNHSLVL